MLRSRHIFLATTSLSGNMIQEARISQVKLEGLGFISPSLRSEKVET